MRAVVLRGLWSGDRLASRWSEPRVEVEDVPRREPGFGEVIVTPRSVGVCGSDFGACRADASGRILFSGPLKLPVTLGHEVCGVVTQVGEGVGAVSKGQVIVGETLEVCGECRPCKSLLPNQCESARLLGLTVDGAMAEEVVLGAKLCWPVDNLLERAGRPDELIDALTFAEPVACVANGLKQSHRALWLGARVLVIGLGPIGLSAALMLRQLTGHPPVAVDRSEERCALAARGEVARPLRLEVGAETLSFFLASVRDEVGGALDLIVEAAGVPSVCFPGLVEALGAHGELLYMARAGQTLRLPADLLVSRALRVFGTRGPNGGAMGDAIDFIAARQAEFAGLLSSKVGFDAMESVLSERDYLKEGKIIFSPEV